MSVNWVCHRLIIWFLNYFFAIKFLNLKIFNNQILNKIKTLSNALFFKSKIIINLFLNKNDLIVIFLKI